jgi:hypothetical protein
MSVAIWTDMYTIRKTLTAFQGSQVTPRYLNGYQMGVKGKDGKMEGEIA